MFEADILQNADMAEAEGFMEADGCGLPGRITNDRDHLPEAKRSGPFNERSQQRVADAAAVHIVRDIDRIFERPPIRRP